MSCTICKKEIKGFKDPRSIKEYKISGMCQECQDKTFGTGHAQICEECGKEIAECEGIPIGNGNYIVCSNGCAMRLVGL